MTTPNSTFRESDHPRVGKGSPRGGEFTTKDAWRQVGHTTGLALATGAGATATGAFAVFAVAEFAFNLISVLAIALTIVLGAVSAVLSKSKHAPARKRRKARTTRASIPRRDTKRLRDAMIRTVEGLGRDAGRATRAAGFTRRAGSATRRSASRTRRGVSDLRASGRARGPR
jgi:hypothetical protein